VTKVEKLVRVLDGTDFQRRRNQGGHRGGRGGGVGGVGVIGHFKGEILGGSNFHLGGKRKVGVSAGLGSSDSEEEKNAWEELQKGGMN